MRWAWVAVLLLVAFARAGDDRPQRRVADPGLQKRINQAVERGIEYLREQQEPEGNWVYAARNQVDLNGGMTALALYALAASGVGPDDTTIRRGLDWVKQHSRPYGPKASHGTYSASLLVLALTRISARIHRVRIHRLADLIAKSQQSNDMWTYMLTGTKTSSGKKKNKIKGGEFLIHGAGDNSNSQFAILAMWAARSLAGWKAPTASWRRVRDFYARTQTAKGGWNYRAPPAHARGRSPGPGSPTMTSAGLVSYVYAHAALNGGQYALERARKSKVARDGLEAYRAVTRNTNWQSYYLVYSRERVGTVLDLPIAEWYEPGARALVASQQHDGSWHTVYNTALALLFLSRATSFTITPRDATSKGGGFPDLTKPGQLERAFDFYVAFNPRKREKVVREFGKAGPAAIGLFVEKLGDHRELVRTTAFELLTKLLDRELFFDPKATYRERQIMLESIRASWTREKDHLRWDERLGKFTR